MKHRLICSLLATYAVSLPIFSQEALKSTEEEYYDFLSLQGLAERPTLGYRTLSDSEWTLTEEAKTADENVWKNNSLGSKWTVYEPAQKTDNFFTRGIDQSIKVKIYGPEWYNSYNTAAPYGQNDGALWQGKGYNTSLTAGARLEAYGLEATFKPQLSFSQNKEFDIMPSAYDSKYGYFWGYGDNKGVDAPQRFGDKAFFTYDWGDTEIRYTWHNFTTGIGTQAIWLGPAWLNPLLHSNNAPSYPKFDIGLRKTSIHLPWLGWYVGDVEGRMWIGYLTESDYFDNDISNDHNQITGLTLAYAPSFFPGLTLGATKICLSKWNDSEFYKYLNPLYGTKGAADGNEVEDQKIAFTANWIVPKGGIDVYAEFGIDDHINWHDTLESYITHYWHAFTYTFGLKKTVKVNEKHNMYGEIIFEWNNTEMSQDYQMHWPYNFGFHHCIMQGYTNRGQWLGSGIGYGGQSQYLAFKLYYPTGNTLFYIHRYNPDNNFLFKEAIYDISTGDDGDLSNRTWNFYKGILAIGINTEYFIDSNIKIGGGATYERIVNPLYNIASEKYDVWNNFQLCFSAKYIF